MPNNDTAPIPNYPSERLIGIELEFDAGGTRLNLPDRHPGWQAQHDGSLRNGREFVLNPPLQLNRAKDTVKNFLDACDKARTNTTKRGGYHIHVQAHDYSEDHSDSYNLVRIYSHFQPVINLLVGKSRVNNTYCPPYNASITLRGLIEKFNLNEPASDRGNAKYSRAYSVVNLAMMRCRTARDRTVEFRQGSPSKRFECVWGWACLMVALVDMARDRRSFNHRNMSRPPTLENFVDMIVDHEQRVGAQHLGDWVVWRHDYLNSAPDEELITKAVQSMGVKPRGLFYISRELNINLALATRVMEAATSRRLVMESSGPEGTKRYRAQYGSWAEKDLEALEAAAIIRARTAPPRLTPLNETPNEAPVPAPATDEELQERADEARDEYVDEEVFEAEDEDAELAVPGHRDDRPPQPGRRNG